MKLAFTVSNACDLVNAGGEIERHTWIMDIPDESLPPYIRQLLADRKDEDKKRSRWYESLSLSIVEE